MTVVFGRRWIFSRAQSGLRIAIVARWFQMIGNFVMIRLNTFIERGVVIGGVLDAWILAPYWERGKFTLAESRVKLENVIDFMKQIYELAGNANHVGIGTDLDSSYGRE